MEIKHNFYEDVCVLISEKIDADIVWEPLGTQTNVQILII